jgi:hypothetical protein
MQGNEDNLPRLKMDWNDDTGCLLSRQLLDDVIDALDSTRHLRRQACTTNDEALDTFMADNVRYLRTRYIREHDGMWGTNAVPGS